MQGRKDKLRHIVNSERLYVNVLSTHRVISGLKGGGGGGERGGGERGARERGGRERESERGRERGAIEREGGGGGYGLCRARIHHLEFVSETNIAIMVATTFPDRKQQSSKDTLLYFTRSHQPLPQRHTPQGCSGNSILLWRKIPAERNTVIFYLRAGISHSARDDVHDGGDHSLF